MRCPVCKAENSQGPQCRRCKADLSLLFALESQRRRTMDEVKNCLCRGDGTRAARHAATVDWLRGDTESQRLTALAHLLAGDFAQAWSSYRRYRAAQNEEPS
jgi:hypothetical protein